MSPIPALVRKKHPRQKGADHLKPQFPINILPQQSLVLSRSLRQNVILPFVIVLPLF